MLRVFRSALLAAATLGGGLAQADVQVLTSIKPLQLIAAAVQDGAGTPDVLLPPGASAHHYALRPSDLRRLEGADLFYWVGPDMEGFLADVLRARQVEALPLQSLPGLTLRHFGKTAATGHTQADTPEGHGHDEHEHEHEPSEHAGDHDHAHRTGSLDAHLWLHTGNARVIAQRMAEDLAARDPTNATRYRANLQRFERSLEALDRRLAERLGPLKAKPYFVFHDAYGYLEAAYGLEHRGVFNLAGEVQPGARYVADLRERLQATGPSCVFSEPPLQPRLLQTLTADLPVRAAELDPLGSAVKPGADGYAQLMEQIAGNLARCLESL